MVFFVQRLVLIPSWRESVAKLLAIRLPQWTHVTVSGADGNEIRNLDVDGFCLLPGLVDEENLSELLEWLRIRPVYDRWNPTAGWFHPDDPPPDCHAAPYGTLDVVNAPSVLEIANDARILNIVGLYLGVMPTISNINIWWSYPGHSVPQEAEHFHRDVDDWRFLKLFIYLSEVDEQSGPHVFVRGSHRRRELRAIRRYSDLDIKKSFGARDIITFCGGRGTAFLANTFGLHKAQLATNKRRLLLQVQYSMHPIGIYSYQPVNRAPGRCLSFNPYINRLYLKS